MENVDPLIGRQLANFRIDRLLGRGGMGSVYAGWDVRLHRPVAIKVIDARYREDPTYAERFIQEARAVASWQHPNILQVHYADDQNGIYYFVMEYVRGLDLGQLLRQYAAVGELMPIEDVLRIGGAVADALDYAHRKGVIHRDVKPSNVIVSDDGRVVLADFGLAMNVGQGSQGKVFGSPQYMSPEQARNSAQVVPQSDLYSLGVMLFQMLTGALPFNDPSPASLALQHITKEPPSPRLFNPDLSPAVEAVLLKALSKFPKERYQSGRDLMDALERAFREVGATEPLPVGQVASKTSPSHSRTKPVSHTSVAERVDAFLGEQHVAGVEEPVSAPTIPQGRIGTPIVWAGLGCWLVVLITAIFLIISIILAARGQAAPQAVSISSGIVIQQETAHAILPWTSGNGGEPSDTNAARPESAPGITLPHLRSILTSTGDRFTRYYDQTRFISRTIRATIDPSSLKDLHLPRLNRF